MSGASSNSPSSCRIRTRHSWNAGRRDTAATTGSNASAMRRSFSAVTISSVTRILTRRWASRSTLGFHIANEPRRRLLAASSDSWARLIASSVERAWRGALTPPIEAVTATGPDLVGTTSLRMPARNRSAAIFHVVHGAVLQHHAEFVAGEAAELSPARSRARMRCATSPITSSATSKPKASLICAK